MLQLKVIQTTSPQGYRVLRKNERGRWERYSGQHWRTMDGVVEYLNKLDVGQFTVQYPNGGISHMGPGWILD